MRSRGRWRWPAVALGALAVFAAWRQYDGISPWIRSCWLVDYEFGFLKRGLPGWVLGPGPVSEQAVRNVSLLVLGLLVGALVAAAACLWSRSRDPGLHRWLLLFLLAPFTIAQWAHDAGRFDQLNYLATGLAVTLLLAGGRWTLLVLPLASLQLCIHEIAIFLQLPTIGVLWYAMCRSRGVAPVGPAAFAGVTAISLLLVLVCGQPAVTMAELAAHLSMRSPDGSVPAGFTELYWMGFQENLALTVQRLSWRTLRHLLILAVVGWPIWVMTVRAWSHVLRGGPRHGRLLPLSGLLGLPLFLLGFDYQRWIGCLLLDQWLLLLAWSHHRGRLSALGDVVRAHPRWWWAALFSCVALGPIGVTSTMELRFALLRF